MLNEDNYKNEIDKWISSLTPRSSDVILEVVRAVLFDYELLGSKICVPDDLRRIKARDLMAVLSNLHDKGLINVLNFSGLNQGEIDDLYENGSFDEDGRWYNPVPEYTILNNPQLFEGDYDHLFIWIQNLNDFKYLHEKLRKLHSKREREPFFGFDGKTFWINRPNAKPAIINFHPRQGESTDTFVLLKLLVSYLEKYGTLNNEGWLEVEIPNVKLKNYLTKTLPVNKSASNWLKTTKANLKRKIPSNCQDLIVFGYYKPDNKGQKFAIKSPHC